MLLESERFVLHGVRSVSVIVSVCVNQRERGRERREGGSSNCILI